MLLVLFLRVQKYSVHIMLKCHIYYIFITSGSEGEKWYCKKDLEKKGCYRFVVMK